MFGLFKSKKSSPNRPDEAEQQQPPPIPGPETEDFVLVGKGDDPAAPSASGLYPSFPPGAVPPGPTTSNPRREVHFLHGVPFKLSKELTAESHGDVMAAQIAHIMASCGDSRRFERISYDFAVEKSVLSES